VSSLAFLERAAARPADGLLVLHHGRGSDERDMLGLGNALDPERRLHIVAPRGPLTLPGWPGYHWYRVPRVGYPDPDTFRSAYAELAQLHEELWERTGLGPERTVLGGFSMGSVMSYALGLGPDRPAPAGLLVFSGFIPTVEGWSPSPESRSGLRAWIAHGTRDQVMSVEFARDARERLESAGLAVEYRESDGAHEINATDARAASEWLTRVPGRLATSASEAEAS
jgi:phospholipase/carboxylesterase